MRLIECVSCNCGRHMQSDVCGHQRTPATHFIGGYNSNYLLCSQLPHIVLDMVQFRDGLSFTSFKKRNLTLHVLHSFVNSIEILLSVCHF